MGKHVEHGLVITLAVLSIAPTRSGKDVCCDDSDSQHREWLICRNQADVLTLYLDLVGYPGMFCVRAPLNLTCTVVQRQTAQPRCMWLENALVFRWPFCVATVVVTLPIYPNGVCALSHCGCFSALMLSSLLQTRMTTKDPQVPCKKAATGRGQKVRCVFYRIRLCVRLGR